MNPSSGENQPVFNVERAPTGKENATDKSVEKGVSASPESGRQTQNLQASSQAASSMALPSQAITVGGQPMATPVAADDDASGTANDADRIEPEWVDRAKSVIAKTRDDPFIQNSEMSKVKAEYIKKRFNKTVKTDDAITK